MTTKEKPFDWVEFLNKESYTIEELTNAAILSKGWVTCACGNLCDAIPRNKSYEPIDKSLYAMGLEFNVHIAGMYNSSNEYRLNHHKKLAIDTLFKIEKLAGEILEELNK